MKKCFGAGHGHVRRSLEGLMFSMCVCVISSGQGGGVTAGFDLTDLNSY